MPENYEAIKLAIVEKCRGLEKRRIMIWRRPANADWFDPTNGAYTTIPGEPFANTGMQQFTPPANNHDGDGDWVLLLDASGSNP